MTARARTRDDEPFDIHEDVRYVDGSMFQDNPQVPHETWDPAYWIPSDADMEGEQRGHMDEKQDVMEDEEEMEEEMDEEDDDETDPESSDDEAVDPGVQADMDKLQADFPGFKDKYRLIKRIGEGTFSTVYKAEDVLYDHYDNSWDLDNDARKWASPPLKSRHAPARRPRSRARFVAVKKIYVTSSPQRIFNELDLLFDLRGCRSVCPLITAFRHTDQVVAVLPYFRHADFRHYFRDMTIPDIAVYMRCMFTALASVHDKKILHRDIKPTNFLYDPVTQHGVLVDFGLAEREGTDSKPCLCHEGRDVRKHRHANSVWAQTAASAPTQPGYPKSDTRPARRANRAGTRGFRAPEVLFKCSEQTTAIDVWSVGVIMLTILSKRFPFFNSPDDVEAMIEIATIFGSRRMKAAGLLHGCVFETTIPTVGQQGFTMEKIVLWSTCRSDDKQPLSDEERLAVRFLERCMELDPSRRITAEQALEHEFLAEGLGSQELGEDDVDMLPA